MGSGADTEGHRRLEVAENRLASHRCSGKAIEGW